MFSYVKQPDKKAANMLTFWTVLMPLKTLSFTIFISHSLKIFEYVAKMTQAFGEVGVQARGLYYKTYYGRNLRFP